MAGHSKWANIKHRKGAQDAKRGKIFTKLIREITVSAKMGGDDITANPRLRAAVDKALSNNMTRDTIDRAIKRGAGTGDSENLAEVRYEGYGPGGVAVMVDCLTDNKNRTVAEVRHAFTKTGGNLGTDGSVAYLFNQQGQLLFSKDNDEEQVMEIAILAGAQDIQVQDDDSILVITNSDNYFAVKQAFEDKEITIDSSELTMEASTKVDINDKEAAEKLLKMIDMLEDLDDVQDVYSNAEVADEILEGL